MAPYANSTRIWVDEGTIVVKFYHVSPGDKQGEIPCVAEVVLSPNAFKKLTGKPIEEVTTKV